MKAMQEDYFIGLDVGTDSVGWAASDTNYNLLKCNQKALWGVRLFDEAHSATERRSFRTSRRRLERSRQRLDWLQEIFSEEIAKKDPAFFQRLQASKYDAEDKETFSGRPLGKHILFADTEYTDKDFFSDYPTIYHLRHALMSRKGPFDVRLVYLALHHILKHRGHFLFENLGEEQSNDGQEHTHDEKPAFISPEALREGLERVNGYLEAHAFSMDLPDDKEYRDDVPEQLFEIKQDTLEIFEGVLTDKTLSVSQKHKKLLEGLNISKTQTKLNNILKLMTGGTVKLKDLYDEETEGELKSICLKKDWEQNQAKLAETLGERLELILGIKQIYDYSLLSEILGKEASLSAAKIKLFEKHREDLKRLKKLIRGANEPALYKEIFRTARKDLNNYPAYSGHGSANYQCSYDDFRSYLKKSLSGLPESEELSMISAELDSGEFLPKQVTKDNGVIPHQVHEYELKRILENASAYLPFLNETDSSGLTRREQIERMFRFRIPYYVGPLNNNSPFGWAVRKEDKIYPWNFQEVVDLEKCAENFITRMTAKCSYTGKDVLPKASLLYSRFTALNELNNLRINGEKPPVEIKQKIYNECLLQGKGRNISSYLLSEGLIKKEDKLSGIDGNIKTTLASWRALGWLLERPKGKEAAEDIIRQITLFNEDKKLLERYLTKNYAGLLSKEELNKVMHMKFDGWGRLSKEFLTQIYHVDKNTGECMNIMDALWNTNDNLMELLSGSYSFKEGLEEFRLNEWEEIGYTLKDYLDQSYASPSIRRAIRQSIHIIGEIEQITKRPPKRIFIETTREEREKKRTDSRRDALLELYKNCQEEAGPLFQSLEARSDGELRRDKLYLYYTQLGKCMYSGESINLSELDANYDIDHIYPQSLTKDDSLNNRVLVKRVLNANKKDVFPLSSEIRNKMQSFWAMLNSKGLISEKKYARLTRHTPLSEEELSGFINRQLVETSQSAKLIAELLKKRYEAAQTEIVYVKAGNVSSFRQDQRIDSYGNQKQAGQCTRNEETKQDPVFTKCREVNDFHHAKDAYLNIVVGNVYHIKFTSNPLNFIRQAKKNAGKDQADSSNGRYGYSLNHTFDFDVERNGEKAWIAGENGSIAAVRRTMTKNNILFTRFAHEEKGGFFDQTLMPKKKGQFPIKSNMSIEKYGGYNKLTGAYFCLVEHTNKKKRVRSIETVYIVNRQLYESSPVKYCEEILGLEQPRIILPKIRIDSLFSIDGSRVHISGRTNEQIIYKNANQLILAPHWNAYIKGIAKYLERCRAARKALAITPFDGINSQDNIALYQQLLEKLHVKQYAVVYRAPLEALEKGFEKFTSLAVNEQCEVLVQILNLFTCKAVKMNLKLLGGKENMGIITRAKNLNTGSNLKLIHQSVTGIFEREVDLMTVDAE